MGLVFSQSMLKNIKVPIPILARTAYHQMRATVRAAQANSTQKDDHASAQ